MKSIKIFSLFISIIMLLSIVLNTSTTIQNEIQLSKKDYLDEKEIKVDNQVNDNEDDNSKHQIENTQSGTSNSNSSKNNETNNEEINKEDNVNEDLDKTSNEKSETKSVGEGTNSLKDSKEESDEFEQNIQKVGEPLNQDGNIVFNDNVFKSIIIDQGYDQNNDNEISVNEMEAINTLHMGYYDENNRLSNIDEIKYAKNLESLDIGSNHDLTSFDALKENTKLKHLGLSNYNTNLDNLNVISNFKDLKELRLWIYNCEITDISFLNTLTKLESLEIDGGGIKSTEIINNINSPNLKELRIWCACDTTQDLSKIHNFTDLEELTLNQQNISDLSVLKSLTKLRRLEVMGNDIIDVSPLKELNNIEYLNIENNNSLDLDSLEELSINEIYCGQETRLNNVKINKGEKLEIDVPEILVRANNENSKFYTKNYSLHTYYTEIQASFNQEKTKIVLDTENLDIGKHWISVQLGDIETENNINISSTRIYIDLNVIEDVGEKYKINFEDSTLEAYMKARYDFDDDKEITNFDMAQIDYLSLYYYEGINVERDCYSLKGLEYAVNVKSISLYTYNNLDFTPLTQMSKLRDISIGGNNYSLSKIAEINNLERFYLNISSTEFNVDLTPISQLTELNNLSILNYNNYGNASIDASLFANMKKLRHLELRCNVININELAKLKSVTNFDMETFGKLENIEFVKDMEKVQTLRLNNNKITDITPLLYLNDLSSAELIRNPINPEEPNNANTLEELKNRNVRVYIDKFDDSEIIEFEDENFKNYLIERRYDLDNSGTISKYEMEQIKELSISNNSSGNLISKINELEYATNLERLYISSYNRNVNISIRFLSKMNSLKYLSLNGYEFSDYDDFEFLENLENLEEFEYQLHDIQFNIERLRNCHKLRVLRISAYHGIKNIMSLSNLENLELLSILKTNHDKELDVNEVVESINKEKIKRVILTGTLKNVESIWQLKNLESLTLQDQNYYEKNKKTDFLGIQNLVNLQNLTISGFKNLTNIDNLESIINLNKLNSLELDIGNSYYGDDVLNQNLLVHIINNIQCSNIRLRGTIYANLKMVECGSKKEIDFENLCPIMQEIMNPESKIYNSSIKLNKSYGTGKDELEIDNNNNKIIINTGNEIGRREVSLSNYTYGDKGFLGNIRISWNNSVVVDNPTEVNIPDENFRNALLEKYDIDDDKKITTNDLKNLTEIDLDNYRIEDITGLECAENLKSVSFINNKISDLTPLGNKTKLLSIEMDCNRISDLTPIKNNLKNEEVWAGFSNNYITDLTGLEEIYFFHIDLSNNYLDMSENSNNYNIVKNHLRTILIRDYEEHPEWYSEEFDVEEAIRTDRVICMYGKTKYGSPYEREDILEFEPNIKSKLLSLGCDENEDGNLTKGEVSDFDFTKCDDFSNLGITNIENFKYFAHARNLNLSNNNITDISPLKYCKNLSEINLSNNNISNIDAVGDFYYTTDIDLSNNKIKNINSLKNLRTANSCLFYGSFRAGDGGPMRVLNLNLSNNQITDISVINKLTTLSSINLSENRITDISALANYDFNKLFGNIREEEMQWFDDQPVTIDVSNNIIKVDSEGTKKAVKHFEDNKSTIKLDNQTAPQYGLGDVNGDGKINVIDCTAILKHIKGTKLLSEDEQSRADINKDKRINVIDCTAILKHIKGTKLIEG